MILHFTKSQIEDSYNGLRPHNWPRDVADDWLHLMTEVERLRLRLARVDVAVYDAFAGLLGPDLWETAQQKFQMNREAAKPTEGD